MTRKSILLLLLLSLLASQVLAAAIPGQDVTAHARMDYRSEVCITAGAAVSYTDHTNSIQQAESTPSTAILLLTAGAVTSAPARSFVAPDDCAPVYYTPTSSFYSGPSLVGKCVRVAGKLRKLNGFYCIDDGATVPDPAGPAQLATIPLCIDLLSGVPAEGSTVLVQGVVRLGDDQLPWLLPLGNSSVTVVQP